MNNHLTVFCNICQLIRCFNYLLQLYKDTRIAFIWYIKATTSWTRAEHELLWFICLLKGIINLIFICAFILFITLCNFVKSYVEFNTNDRYVQKSSSPARGKYRKVKYMLNISAVLNLESIAELCLRRKMTQNTDRMLTGIYFLHQHFVPC